MSRYQMKKKLSRVGDRVDDFLEDAEDTYDSLRKDVRRKAANVRGRVEDVRDQAGDAWEHRGDLFEDIADGIVSYGECAASMAADRFKRDPVGTIALGAIAFWLIGRLARR